jgi:hypothetical protein
MTAALNITAVNTGTDELTKVAHGLLTGAGPVAVYASAGTLPTGSPAINPVTDYWVIRTGADTFKLATSSANALLGTAIDITVAGTAVGGGALFVLIGAPYRRSTTYVNGISQIDGGHLNDAEDAQIALWNLLSGQAQSIYSAVKFAVPVTFAGGIVGTRQIAVDALSWVKAGASATFDATLWKWTFPGFDSITVPIRPEVGKTITGARFCFNRTGSTINFKIQRRTTGAGAWTDVVAGSDSATVGAGVGVLSTSHVVLADTQYRLYFDAVSATFDASSFDISM